MNETPGQVLQRMVNARWGAYVPAGDWSELSEAARVGYDELAAAFLAEMDRIREEMWDNAKAPLARSEAVTLRIDGVFEGKPRPEHFE